MAVRIPIVTVFDNKGLKSAEYSLKKVQGNFRNIGRNLAVAGAAIGGFGAVTLKAFGDFDAKLTQSTAIMGNLSDEIRTKMSDTARDVALNTTISAEQAAEAYFFLASAGLDAESSIAALPQVAAFAQAGMFDMATATDLLTDAQSALGMVIKGDSLANLEEMTRLSDVLVKANTLANASVQQFSEALTTKAGAALKAVNKDVTEGVAVLAAFADQGIKGAYAGTQFSIIMRDLTTKAIDNRKAFAAAGISVFDTAGNMNNLGDIIGDLEGALAGMSDETQKATLLQLGFSDKSLASLTALLGTSDAIKTYEESLRSASGLTDEVASKQLETLNSQLILLKNAFVDVGISVGEQLAPALGDLIPKLQEILPALGEKLVAAVQAVDWEKLATDIANVVTFFVENIDAIMKTVTALFILNTAWNVGKVAVGLYTASVAITTAVFGKVTAAAGIATVAVNLFRAALLLSGVGAAIVALGFIVEGISKSKEGAREATPVVTSFGDAILKTGEDAEWAAGKYGIATTAVTEFNSAVAAIDLTKIGRTAATSRPLRGGMAEDFFARQDFREEEEPDPQNKGSAAAKIKQAITPIQGLNKALAAEVKKQNAFVRLTKKAKISEGFAQAILSGAKPLKTAAALVKSSTEKITKQQAKFNKTAAGQAEIASIASASAAADYAAAQAAAAAAQAAADKARRAEEARIAEQKRIYQSFADSVANTFAGIKATILGAFSLPSLGNSTDSIIRNMDKLLARVKSFSGNITKLSSMGLDPKLLQQVINAGPIAGAKLAANLVAGGAGALSSINTGYAELGNLASGIGMTGTSALYGTQQQQTIYNINVEGGLDSSASIGKAVVDAVKAYERTSGAVWQGA